MSFLQSHQQSVARDRGLDTRQIRGRKWPQNSHAILICWSNGRRHTSTLLTIFSKFKKCWQHMKVGNQMRLDFELLSSSLFDFLPSWARFASFMENTGLQGGLEFFIIVSDFYLTCGNIPYKCGHRSNLWRRRNLYGSRSTRKTQKLGGAYAGPFRSFNTLYDRSWRFPWCSNFFFFFFFFFVVEYFRLSVSTSRKDPNRTRTSWDCC